ACGDVHHHVAEAELVGRLGRCAQRRAPQQRAHTLEELEHPEWLRDVLVRVEPEAAHLVRFLATRREDDHRHVVAVLADRGEHAVAIEPREHEIEDHEVRLPRARVGEPALAVLSDAHVVTLVAQIVGEPLGERRVVLDDEDAPHHRCTGAGSASATGAAIGEAGFSSHAGSVTTNRAPRPPGASSTHARPPCCATTSWTTERPTPLPAVPPTVAPR